MPRRITGGAFLLFDGAVTIPIILIAVVCEWDWILSRL
jgi:hypothetical protein